MAKRMQLKKGWPTGAVFDNVEVDSNVGVCDGGDATVAIGFNSMSVIVTCDCETLFKLQSVETNDMQIAIL
ncbi:hypothetical protein VNO77_41989 [Canavalia gladiata]|uniref:Uncharacterized protein n=1 Tax=Canavalia gladiata TaxID=3824 RepID=A0AAN9JZV5_CANGL